MRSQHKKGLGFLLFFSRFKGIKQGWFLVLTDSFIQNFRNNFTFKRFFKTKGYFPSSQNKLQLCICWITSDNVQRLTLNKSSLFVCVWNADTNSKFQFLISITYIQHYKSNVQKTFFFWNLFHQTSGILSCFIHKTVNDLAKCWQSIIIFTWIDFHIIIDNLDIFFLSGFEFNFFVFFFLCCFR